MKLDIKIMAVKARRAMVAQLLSETKLPADIVVYDDRGEKGGGDAWYTAKKAWLSPLEKGATHRLVIQDDCEICDNFIEICKKIITVFPDVIWCFHGGTWIDKSVRKNNSPYVNIKGCNTCGPAIILPVQHIKPMIEWSDGILGETYKHDDCRIGLYALCNDVKVFTTIPSLTTHIGFQSFIRGHTSRGRVCKLWIGKDIGVQDWDNTEYGETPLRTNNTWIDPEKEPEKQKRILKMIAEAKERLRNGR